VFTHAGDDGREWRKGGEVQRVWGSHVTVTTHQHLVISLPDFLSSLTLPGLAERVCGVWRVC